MNFEDAMEEWEPINSVDPRELTEARLQAHWAVQIIGGTGEALVSHEPGFSHTSMSWLEGARMLAGQATTLRGLRVALRIADMTMHVLDGSQRSVAFFELDGLTLGEALQETIRILCDGIGAEIFLPPEIPTYQMPGHPVSRGAPFRAAAREHREELARWYANAARFESVVTGTVPGASPVRCWPHHFDIATLIALDSPSKEAETARSIGFGLSPGDSSYDEPYFYVNPWPFPEVRTGHADLPGGAHWHTNGWFGAVLRASRIEAHDAREQARQVQEYVIAALAADRAILGESSERPGLSSASNAGLPEGRTEGGS